MFNVRRLFSRNNLSALVATVLLFAFMGTNVQAQSVQYSDLIITPQMGVYTLSGDVEISGYVVVQDGATLRIAAGTNLYFHWVDSNPVDSVGDAYIEVKEGGTIEINGTASSPVLFTSFEDLNDDDEVPAYAGNNAWMGIIIEGDTSTADVFSNFEVRKAYSGFTVARPGTISGLTLTNAGLTVDEFDGDLTLRNLSIESPATNGIVINKSGMTLRYTSINKAPTAGIVVNASDVLIDFCEIDSCGTGIINNSGGTNTIVQNTYITYSDNSGIFNLDGDIQVKNSQSDYNGANGILNSSGILTANEFHSQNNSGYGVLVGGTSTSEVTYSTVKNNDEYGFYIMENKLTTDGSNVSGGEADGSLPNINVTRTEISGNNGGADSVQVYNGLASATPVAYFTKCFWGRTFNVAPLVGMATPNSVEYRNFYTDGSLTGNDADLTKDITITFPTSGYVFNDGQTLTVEWETTGFVPFVKITTDGASGNDVTVNNNQTEDEDGSYTITLNGTDHTTLTLEDPNDDTITNSITLTNSGSLAILNTSDISSGDTLYTRTEYTLNWETDSQSDVTLKLAPNYGYFGLNQTTATIILDGSSNSTTAGTTDLTTNTTISSATTYSLTLDGTGTMDLNVGSLSLEQDGTLSADGTRHFTLVAAPPWESDSAWNVTETSVTMTVKFKDVDMFTEYDASGNGAYSEFGTNHVWVGAFYLNESNQIKCAGYSLVETFNSTTTTSGSLVMAEAGTTALYGHHVYNDVNDDDSRSEPVTVKVYGDEPSTSTVDGITEGSQIIWKIWTGNFESVPNNFSGTTHADSMQYDFDLDSPVGHWQDRQANASTAVTFSDGGAVLVDELIYIRNKPVSSGTEVQNIPLTSGWQIVSGYVKPGTKTLGWKEFTTNSIANENILTAPPYATYLNSQGLASGFTSDGTIDYSAAKAFMLLKDGEGNVYWNTDSSEANIVDQLGGEWNYKKAYQLKMSSTSSSDTLRLIGEEINPVNEPLSLSTGWNLVPFFRNEDVPLDVAMASILANVEIVKDGSGRVYWPSQSIANLTTLSDGEGYWVKMSAADVLQYPLNTFTKASAEQQVVEEPSHFVVGFNSDNYAVVAVVKEALEERAKVGDELGFFDAEGNLVGSSVYEGENVAVALWGQESGAEDAAGLKAGEQYSVRLYSQERGEEIELGGIVYQEGGQMYEPNGLAVISGFDGRSSLLPKEFSLGQNYPNPFNPTTTIDFALPKDAKVTLKVYNILGEVVAELVNDVFKAGYHTVEFDAKRYASGIYFYQIQAGDFKDVKKMNLLK